MGKVESDSWNPKKYKLKKKAKNASREVFYLEFFLGINIRETRSTGRIAPTSSISNGIWKSSSKSWNLIPIFLDS